MTEAEWLATDHLGALLQLADGFASRRKALLFALAWVEAWKWDVGPPGRVVTCKLTTGGEEVEVPAGKFKAVRVEAEAGFPAPFAVTRTTYWHAPGVGVVKTVEQIKGGDRVEVLKAFTPGPKK